MKENKKEKVNCPRCGREHVIDQSVNHVACLCGAILKPVRKFRGDKPPRLRICSLSR